MKGTLLIRSLTPNPARDEIAIELADGVSEAEVAITDMLGAEVLRMPYAPRIDVSTLASGTYYLRVTSSRTSQTRQIVIAR
jgi:hypothetical protein